MVFSRQAFPGSALPIRLAPFVLAAVLLAVHAAAGAAAPTPPAAKPDAVLATLDGAAIRESDFERFLRAGGTPEEAAQIRRDPAARRQALDACLDLAVFAAKARKDGIDKTPAFRKACELMEMKILVQRFTERDRERLTKAATPTDEELRDYYDRRPDQFLVPPGFTARQILLYVKGNPAFPDKGSDDAAAEARAREALGKLRAGETWESVAKAYSEDDATNQRGGLMPDALFGYYAPEVEAAVRAQKLAQPGDPVKSQFGYHILQVEKRSADGEREPFEKVRKTIAYRLAETKGEASRKAYLDPIRAETGLQETAAAALDVSLLDPAAVKPDEILATLSGDPIRESDFQWFVKDAFRPEQRMQAFSQPGARRSLLDSYLAMRVLEAKARKEKLDLEPSYADARAQMERQLLAEFLQERDKTTAWSLPGATEPQRAAALKQYTDRLRTEMGLKVVPAAAGAGRP